jgi:hypothetical protein
MPAHRWVAESTLALHRQQPLRPRFQEALPRDTRTIRTPPDVTPHPAAARSSAGKAPTPSTTRPSATTAAAEPAGLSVMRLPSGSGHRPARSGPLVQLPAPRPSPPSAPKARCSPVPGGRPDAQALPGRRGTESRLVPRTEWSARDCRLDQSGVAGPGTRSPTALKAWGDPQPRCRRSPTPSSALQLHAPDPARLGQEAPCLPADLIQTPAPGSMRTSGATSASAGRWT